jgi:hypothetical protein
MLRKSRKVGSLKGGSAGYLRIGDDHFMGLALTPNSPSFALRHELHHYAREALFRTGKGQSLFLQELTGGLGTKSRLFVTEELIFGTRALFP